MRTRSAIGVLPPVSHVQSTDTKSDNHTLQELPSIPSPSLLKTSLLKRVKGSHSISLEKGSKYTLSRFIYRGRNVGKLIMLMEMPMDIMCEVCSHLDPIDILHISRANKGLRTMFTSPESKALWRRARANCDGLPDCPSDMSEVTYASLLFEKGCQGCLDRRRIEINPNLRLRLCINCHVSRLVHGEELLKVIPGITEELLECVPCSFTFNSVPFYTPGDHPRYGKFRKDQVNALLVRLNETVSPDLPEEEARAVKNEFIAKEAASVKTILLHSQEISLWIRASAKARSEVSTKTIKKRKAEIRAKLIDLGYHDTDFPDTKAWRRLVGQPRELTPRTWNTLRPKLEEMIEDLKVSIQS